MFERFTPQGRDVVSRALAVAHASGAGEIGVEQLLIALAALGHDCSRGTSGQFSADAKEVLRRAAEGERAGPVEILAALIDLGHAPADWDLAAARDVIELSAAAPPPTDPVEALRAAEPVSVTLGEAELPLGDLGNSRTDARVVLAILAADGPVAKLLGVDEAEVRRLAR